MPSSPWHVPVDSSIKAGTQSNSHINISIYTYLGIDILKPPYAALLTYLYYVILDRLLYFPKFRPSVCNVETELFLERELVSDLFISWET